MSSVPNRDDSRPVFGYVRVSTDRQETERQQQTIPQRHATLPDGLSERPLELFYDHGISAWSGKPRPSFEQMFARVRRGEASALIIDTSSRLTRQGIRHALTLFFDLEDASCRLFTTQGREYTFDLGGIISLIVDAEADERYSATLSHNISTGKAQKAREGLWHHGAVVPGYTNDKGVLSETDDLAVIGQMFKLFAEGRLTYARLCAFLNASLSDETLSRFKGGKVTRDRVRAWLAHPIYAGLIPRRDELHKGDHTPAVSLELFEKAQRRLEENAAYNVRPPRSWPFAGIAKCGSCGHALRLHPIKSRHGRRYVYVRCAGDGCPERHRLPIAAAFEANVLTGLVGISFAILEVLATSDSFGASSDSGVTLEQAKEALTEAQERFEAIGEAVKDGAIKPGDPDYTEAREARDNARAAVELLSRESTSHREELHSLAMRVLSLAEHAPKPRHRSDRFRDEDEGLAVFHAATGVEVPYPDKTIPRVIAGWERADFDTRSDVIQAALESLRYSDDRIEYRFRVPIPLTVTTATAFASERTQLLAELEGDGYGTLAQDSAAPREVCTPVAQQ
jgi:DNA invertase Pin-like site-specific DNA recombinase